MDELLEEITEYLCNISISLERIADHLERNLNPPDSYSQREFVSCIVETMQEGFDKIASKI